MGNRDKLLETINGEPILARTTRIALDADLGPVIVTLRPGDRARKKAIHNHPVSVIEIEDADEGMSASLRTGAKTAIELILAKDEYENEISGMMVLLPDMPEITTEDLKTMHATFRASGGVGLRATDTQGRLGHPTVFPQHILRDFKLLTGDKGAASMFDAENVMTLELGDRARLDLDTPNDWAAWRARTNTPD